MQSLIKSNINARHSSLIEGNHCISLFQINKIASQGIYLNTHQEHRGTCNSKETLIITVFSGSGELSLVESEHNSLAIQITTGDIIAIPNNSSYQILNTDESLLTISKLIIR